MTYPIGKAVAEKHLAAARQRRKKYQTPDMGESLTHQSMRDEVDIKKILERHAVGQVSTNIRDDVGRYGDFTKMTDFQEAMDTVTAVNSAFERLPAELRQQLNNDPVEFAELMSSGDDEAKEKRILLGLEEAPKPPVQENSTEGDTPPVVDAGTPSEASSDASSGRPAGGEADQK